MMRHGDHGSRREVVRLTAAPGTQRGRQRFDLIGGFAAQAAGELELALDAAQRNEGERCIAHDLALARGEFDAQLVRLGR